MAWLRETLTPKVDPALNIRPPRPVYPGKGWGATDLLIPRGDAERDRYVAASLDSARCPE